MHLEKSQQIRNETQIVPKMLAMLNHFKKKKKKKKYKHAVGFWSSIRPKRLFYISQYGNIE